MINIPNALIIIFDIFTKFFEKKIISNKILIIINDNIDNKIEEIIKNKLYIKNKNIDIILETFGGTTMSSKNICNMLYNYKKLYPKIIIRIFIPSHAYSAGTIIALMADELYMNYYSFLSPIDTQSSASRNEIDFSCNDIQYVLNKKSNNSIFNNLDLLYLKNKKILLASNDIIDKYIFAIKNYTKKEKIKIKKNLLYTLSPHFYTFDITELIDMGIKIQGEVPNSIMEIYYQLKKKNYF
jgi:hypothetical protein